MYIYIVTIFRLLILYSCWSGVSGNQYVLLGSWNHTGVFVFITQLVLLYFKCLTVFQMFEININKPIHTLGFEL